MIKLYFTPWSRAVGVLWLLEELGAPYEIKLIDIRAEGGAPEEYRKIQPNKKVPAIEHNGVIVTERAAICLYLTENVPEARMAPTISDPNRAMFLTWLIYCDSVFDPALAAHAQNYEYQASNYSFGSFDDMIANLDRHLSTHPFAAGDAFTAADTQLASGVYFGLEILKKLPDRPVFRRYLERACARPAFGRVMGIQSSLG